LQIRTEILVSKICGHTKTNLISILPAEYQWRKERQMPANLLETILHTVIEPART